MWNECGIDVHWGGVIEVGGELGSAEVSFEALGQYGSIEIDNGQVSELMLHFNGGGVPRGVLATASCIGISGAVRANGVPLELTIDSAVNVMLSDVRFENIMRVELIAGGDVLMRNCTNAQKFVVSGYDIRLEGIIGGRWLGIKADHDIVSMGLIHVQDELVMHGNRVLELGNVTMHDGACELSGGKVVLDGGSINGGIGGGGLRIYADNFTIQREAELVEPSFEVGRWNTAKNTTERANEIRLCGGSSVRVIDGLSLHGYVVKLGDDIPSKTQPEIASTQKPENANKESDAVNCGILRGISWCDEVLEYEPRAAVLVAGSLMVDAESMQVQASAVRVYGDFTAVASGMNVTLQHVVVRRKIAGSATEVGRNDLQDKFEKGAFDVCSPLGSGGVVGVQQLRWNRECDHHCGGITRMFHNRIFRYSASFEAYCSASVKVFSAALIVKKTVGEFHSLSVGLPVDGDNKWHLQLQDASLDNALTGNVDTATLMKKGGWLMQPYRQGLPDSLLKVVESRFVDNTRPVLEAEQHTSMMYYMRMSDANRFTLHWDVQSNAMDPLASDAIIHEKYVSLYTCHVGTETLLQRLERPATEAHERQARHHIHISEAAQEARKVLGTPTVEAILLERIAMEKLGSVDFGVGDGLCSSLEHLILNAEKAKDTFKLQIGKELPRNELRSVQEAFVWPVYRTLVDMHNKQHEVLVLDVYIPELVLKDSAKHAGSYADLGQVKASMTMLANLGSVRFSGGEIIVEQLVQIGVVQNVGERVLNLQFSHALISSIVDCLKSASNLRTDVMARAAIVGMSEASTVHLITDGALYAYATRFKNVVLDAGSHVLVLPMSIINAFRGKLSKNTYTQNVDVKYLLSELQGSVSIISKGEVKLIGVDYSQLANIRIDGVRGVHIESVLTMHYDYTRTVRHSFFSSSVNEAVHYSTNVQDGELGNGGARTGNVEMTSKLGNVTLVGTKVYATHLEIRAGTHDVPRSVQILPASERTLSELMSTKESFGLSFGGGGLIFAKSVTTFNKKDEERLAPTILDVAGDMYIYSAGQYLQLASEIDATGHVHISSPTGYKIAVLDAKEVNYYKLDKKGVGIGFTISTSELSMKLGTFISSESYGITAFTPLVSRITAQSLLIDGGGTLETEGVVMEYGEAVFEVLQHIDKPVFARIAREHHITETELALKLGFRSPLGQALSSTRNVARNINSGHFGTSEALNTGFAAYSMYTSWLKALAMPVQGGLWLEGNYLYDSIHITEMIPVISRLEGNSTTHYAHALNFTGTAVNGTDWFIHAEDVLLQSTFCSYEVRTSHGEVVIDVPVQGNAFDVSASAGKSHTVSGRHVNGMIQLSGTVSMHLTGTLSLTGEYILANSVQLDVGQLILESVRSLEHSSSSAFTLSTDLKAKLHEMVNGGGLQAGHGKKAWIDELTRIIGRDNVEITVAGALKLIGSMIANVDIDPDTEKYTDKTKLSIKAAEIFAQNIYGYDHGKLLGASVKLAHQLRPAQDAASASTRNRPSLDAFDPFTAENANYGFGNEYNADIAYRDLVQQVVATIGTGEVSIASHSAPIDADCLDSGTAACSATSHTGSSTGSSTSSSTQSINRDVHAASSIHGIDVRPVHAYWINPSSLPSAADSLHSFQSNAASSLEATMAKIEEDLDSIGAAQVISNIITALTPTKTPHETQLQESDVHSNDEPLSDAQRKQLHDELKDVEDVAKKTSNQESVPPMDDKTLRELHELRHKAVDPKAMQILYTNAEVVSQLSEKVAASTSTTRLVIKAQFERAKKDLILSVANVAHAALNKYKEFAAEHPLLAEYGLSAFNIVVQGIVTGVPGLINAGRAEVAGHALGSAINTIFGEKIARKINDLSDELVAITDNELEIEKAQSLATVCVVVGVLTISGAKPIVSFLRRLKLPRRAITPQYAYTYGAQADQVTSTATHTLTYTASITHTGANSAPRFYPTIGASISIIGNDVTITLHSGHILSTRTLIYNGYTKSGHVVQKHLCKDYKYMSKHAERSGEASSFPDEDTTANALADILVVHEKEIDNWLNDVSVPVGKEEDFEIPNLGRETGCGLKKGETILSPRYGALMRLLKVSDNPKDRAALLLTAYPTNSNNKLKV